MLRFIYSIYNSLKFQAISKAYLYFNEICFKEQVISLFGSYRNLVHPFRQQILFVIGLFLLAHVI